MAAASACASLWALLRRGVLRLQATMRPALGTRRRRPPRPPAMCHSSPLRLSTGSSASSTHPHSPSSCGRSSTRQTRSAPRHRTAKLTGRYPAAAAPGAVSTTPLPPLPRACPAAGAAAPCGAGCGGSSSGPGCAALPGEQPMSAEKWRPRRGVRKRGRAPPLAPGGGVTCSTQARVRGASSAGTLSVRLYWRPSAEGAMALRIAPDRSSLLLPWGTTAAGCCHRWGEERYTPLQGGRRVQRRLVNRANPWHPQLDRMPGAPGVASSPGPLMVTGDLQPEPAAGRPLPLHAPLF